MLIGGGTGTSFSCTVDFSCDGHAYRVACKTAENTCVCSVDGATTRTLAYQADACISEKKGDPIAAAAQACGW
jgi:hypothetical protein